MPWNTLSAPMRGRFDGREGKVHSPVSLSGCFQVSCRGIETFEIPVSQFRLQCDREHEVARGRISGRRDGLGASDVGARLSVMPGECVRESADFAPSRQRAPDPPEHL